MKKLAAFLLVFALSLWAADFWLSKPFTDWNDKDVDKMLHNSPWAKQIGVAVSSGGGGGMNSGGRGKGGGRTSDIGSDASSPAGGGAGAGDMASSGGGGGRS